MNDPSRDIGLNKNRVDSDRYSRPKTQAMESIVPSKPRFKLENDVVLAAETRLRIEEAINKIKYRDVIYYKWNFISVDPDGIGLSLSLYGRPGTGKTLIAEAIAGTLELPFINISLADLESKFMGETSKNIQAIFKTANEHNAIIFFDEADTILGRRLSSVTQGIDNEVNACRSTLLIELEKFQGITIFASNFVENYDKAFQNRISYHVHIPLPDLSARKSIWRRFLISSIPLAQDREELIEKVSETTDGFSGRDIRTVMRLALPKLFCDENSFATRKLGLHHLEEAISQVKQAQADVGQYVNPHSLADIAKSRYLLGIKQKEEKGE
ncbi:hypothetical protein MASR1M36_09050 [Candidatus Cloacimonadaceae bacterium]